MKKEVKMFMKRIACAAIAVSTVASMSVLTGCSKKENEDNSSSQTIQTSQSTQASQENLSDEPITISIGNWPLEDPELAKMNERKEKFEAENQNVEIIPDTWTFDLQTFYPKAAAGLLPNVFTAFYTEIANLINTGYVADITETMKEMGIYDMMNPVVRDIAMKDGSLYAIPNDSYATGIAVNMDMLKEAGYIEADGTPHQPKDWYELAEMAQKIKAVTGKPGFVMPTAQNSGGWIFTQIAWDFGVDFMEKQDDKWVATFNTDECADALQYVKDLKWKYDVLPADVIVTGIDYTEIFATGGAAMTIGVGAGTAQVVLSYDMNKDSLGFMAIPAGPKGRYALMGGTLTCISSKSDKEQQKAILKWLNLTGLTDAQKESWTSTKEKLKDMGMQIGAKSLASFTGDNPRQKFFDDWTEANINVNPANFKLYNDSLGDSSVQLRAEEPRCVQDLYGILDGCIQKVLQDENADCKALLEEACRNFQEQYLDDLEN